MYLNRVTVVGFTGQEAKTFSTQAGKEITRLSVATTRRYQQDSEWKGKNAMACCVVYGAAAQDAGRVAIRFSLRQGAAVFKGTGRRRQSNRVATKIAGPIALPINVALVQTFGYES